MSVDLDGARVSIARLLVSSVREVAANREVEYNRGRAQGFRYALEALGVSAELLDASHVLQGAVGPLRALEDGTFQPNLSSEL